MAPTERTSIRMNFADLTRLAGKEEDTTRPGGDAPGTIYFLKTSTPHLHDISVSGPYKDLEAVHAQAWHNFGDECRLGQSALQDLKVNGQAMGFMHIDSPINADPNKTRRIELIRKTKPTLAAKLPCDVWNVMKVKPATAAMAAGPTGPNQSAMPVEEVHIIDSFESEAAANQAAQNVVSDLAEPGDKTPKLQSSPFTAGLMKNMDARWIVTVNHDSGAAPQQ